MEGDKSPVQDFDDESCGFDLYTDIVTTDAQSQFDELKKEHETCKQQLVQYSSENKQFKTENKNLAEENEILKRNISLLYRTAKNEVERKDYEIDRLRKKLDHAQNKVQELGLQQMETELKTKNNNAITSRLLKIAYREEKGDEHSMNEATPRNLNHHEGATQLSYQNSTAFDNIEHWYPEDALQIHADQDMLQDNFASEFQSSDQHTDKQGIIDNKSSGHRKKSVSHREGQTEKAKKTIKSDRKPEKKTVEYSHHDKKHHISDHRSKSRRSGSYSSGCSESLSHRVGISPSRQEQRKLYDREKDHRNSRSRDSLSKSKNHSSHNSGHDEHHRDSRKRSRSGSSQKISPSVERKETYAKRRRIDSDKEKKRIKTAEKDKARKIINKYKTEVKKASMKKTSATDNKENKSRNHKDKEIVSRNRRPLDKREKQTKSSDHLLNDRRKSGDRDSKRKVPRSSSNMGKHKLDTDSHGRRDRLISEKDQRVREKNSDKSPKKKSTVIKSNEVVEKENSTQQIVSHANITPERMKKSDTRSRDKQSKMKRGSHSMDKDVGRSGDKSSLKIEVHKNEGYVKEMPSDKSKSPRVSPRVEDERVGGHLSKDRKQREKDKLECSTREGKLTSKHLDKKSDKEHKRERSSDKTARRSSVHNVSLENKDMGSRNVKSDKTKKQSEKKLAVNKEPKNESKRNSHDKHDLKEKDKKPDKPQHKSSITTIKVKSDKPKLKSTEIKKSTSKSKIAVEKTKEKKACDSGTSPGTIDQGTKKSAVKKKRPSSADDKPVKKRKTSDRKRQSGSKRDSVKELNDVSVERYKDSSLYMPVKVGDVDTGCENVTEYQMSTNIMGSGSLEGQSATDFKSDKPTRNEDIERSPKLSLGICAKNSLTSIATSDIQDDNAVGSQEDDLQDNIEIGLSTHNDINDERSLDYNSDDDVFVSQKEDKSIPEIEVHDSTNNVRKHKNKEFELNSSTEMLSDTEPSSKNQAANISITKASQKQETNGVSGESERPVCDDNQQISSSDSVTNHFVKGTQNEMSQHSVQADATDTNCPYMEFTELSAPIGSDSEFDSSFGDKPPATPGSSIQFEEMDDDGDNNVNEDARLNAMASQFEEDSNEEGLVPEDSLVPKDGVAPDKGQGAVTKEDEGAISGIGGGDSKSTKATPEYELSEGEILSSDSEEDVNETKNAVTEKEKQPSRTRTRKDKTSPRTLDKQRRSRQNIDTSRQRHAKDVQKDRKLTPKRRQSDTYTDRTTQHEVKRSVERDRNGHSHRRPSDSSSRAYRSDKQLSDRDRGRDPHSNSRHRESGSKFIINGSVSTSRRDLDRWENRSHSEHGRSYHDSKDRAPPRGETRHRRN
ncbi:uncharacterized protein LOC144432739 [Glandiceps talaboti]